MCEKRSLAVGTKTGYRLYTINSSEKLQETYSCGNYIFSKKINAHLSLIRVFLLWIGKVWFERSFREPIENKPKRACIEFTFLIFIKDDILRVVIVNSSVLFPNLLDFFSDHRVLLCRIRKAHCRKEPFSKTKFLA